MGDFGEIQGCGLCDAPRPRMDLILDLGMQPLAERESPLYPLQLLRCSNCSLVQLSYMVDPREVFPLNHPYATGNSIALHRHFQTLAMSLRPGPGPVVDIGANDGTFLSYVDEEHLRVAVEPTHQADKIKADHVYREFFSLDLARSIRKKCGPAAYVVATNVLAHVADPHHFIEGVRVLLKGDPHGRFITENHALGAITDGLQIDTVYHEHLRYYSVSSLSYLLAQHGFDVVDMTPISTHGGSFRTVARLENTLHLAERARMATDDLHRLMVDLRAEGPIYGIGATTRATPLIHAARLQGLLDCVCEVPQSEKIGTTIPGTTIPIVDEQRLFTNQPPYALLLSWHIAKVIVPKLRERGYKGKFVVPLPIPRVRDQ